MIVLDENKDLLYTLSVYADEDVDDFLKALIEQPLAGERICLTDGRQVGSVLSAAAAPAMLFPPDSPFHEDGAGVVEVQWATPEMMALAKQAEIVIDPEAGVLLVGTQAGVTKAARAPQATIRDLAVGRVDRLELGR